MKVKILLFLILLVGFFIRMYHLDSVPATLSPDEAAIGYNAYSLWKTGADEHGVFLPLVLQSFGDWKLPIYPLLTIIPIFLFGLTEVSVRLVSVFSGVAGILLIYVLSKKLFKNTTVSLFAALFYALNPWSIYFSRQAIEPNVAVVFFLGGLVLFFESMEQKKQRLLLYSFLLFGLTLFTYHAWVVFMPFFAFFLVILFRSKMKKCVFAYAGCGLFLFLVLVSFVSNISTGFNKISDSGVFTNAGVIYARAEKLRTDNPTEPLLLQKFLHTKYLGVPYQILQNYIGVFSPSFLFDKGGEKLLYTTGFTGDFYLFDALLLIVGAYFLIKTNNKNIPFLLLWLLISPIPSIITKDSPSSTRLYQMMPLFVLLSAYGVYEIFVFLKKNKMLFWLGGITLSFLFLLNCVFFLDIYFNHFNFERVRFLGFGQKQAVILSQKYPKLNIVMKSPDNFPYIYFLFYNKYDPIRFRKEVLYYPRGKEGFLLVKGFDRYSFVYDINGKTLQKNTLYIDNAVADDKGNLLGDRRYWIVLPSGEPVFRYYFFN